MEVTVITRNKRPNRVRSESKPSVVKDEIADDEAVSTAELFSHIDAKEDTAPKFSPSSKLLKEVVITSKPSSTGVPVHPAGCEPAPSPSSLSSLGATPDDESSEYETPGTSAVATPAESVVVDGLLFGETSKPSTRARKGAKISAVERAQQLRKRKFSLGKNSNKRKRGWEEAIQYDKDTSTDAQLARALQEQEYEDGPSKRSKTDSDDSGQLEEVGDTMDEDSDPVLPSEIEYFMAKARKAEASDKARRQTNTRTLARKSNMKKKSLGKSKNARGFLSLPQRAARDSARKIIAEEEVLQVQDTEDSGLSEFDIDTTDVRPSDMDESTDSELSDADNNTSASPAISSTILVRRANRALRRRLPRVRGLEGRAQRERKKLEKQHPEVKTMWKTLASTPRITPMQAKQPEAISRQLKSFQLEGLNWMIQQEKSQWKGGLLGDEMGMGKTIQAVSLIMSDYPAKDPTLVVVPPVALMQWGSEIKEYTTGLLKVLVYHNSDPKVKTLKQKDLRKYDVIMISYSGLESLHRKEVKGWKRNIDSENVLIKSDSVIHAIKYHRLILDEAHNIKTRTTGVAKACFALKADFKWCLSGTPVQNRIGEFFSLLRFLNVKPFASYFCKACDCNELHWSQDEQKRCTHCSHRGFDHVSIFNQELLNPITQAGDPELRSQALDKLRLITDRIMLRRVKRDHTESMELPPKEVIIHNEFFGEIERDFSSSIMSNTTRQFDTYVSRGVMLNNYANIFGLIMQMRQVANHPDLILKKHAEGGQNVLVCTICDEPAEEAIRSRCHHEFCRRCVKDFIYSSEGTGGEPDCPRCHIPLSIDLDQPDIEQDEDTVKKSSIINRIKMEDWTSSTKIEMLVYDLYKLRSKKATHKSIVFSQFTSMLQLVEWRLRRAGFNTVMLDGSMSPAQRQRSIEHFMKNTDVEVFLVSLKAGGVALNLTEASRVFIIDPWWNPAAEWQSADRCHRIGQKRPCVITRLCIEDSVESRMVMLQEKKANMINGTINNDKVAMEKLTPEDMQFLFRGA
ncbi:MAG: DNA repair protein rad16 [Candelina submexicana]|nr:MAG: DNA repair protein rad16 [Candelina submexicana]